MSECASVVVNLPSNLLEMPLVRQGTNYTCGVSALMSILTYWGFADFREDRLALELRSNSTLGTSRHELERVAKSLGLFVEQRTEMTLEELKTLVGEKKQPVIVTLQAWKDEDEATPWKDRWDDGHYAVVVGFDDRRLFFMDPSTLGSYTFIEYEEFLERWHDIDDIKLHQHGIIISKDDPKTHLFQTSPYDPRIPLRMS